MHSPAHMILQKQISRRTGGKTYLSWIVTVPPKKVAQLGWKKGYELIAEPEGTSLVIRFKSKEVEVFKPTVAKTDSSRTTRSNSQPNSLPSIYYEFFEGANK